RSGAQNHNPEENEGDWTARKQVAVQAYLEWMPVRDPVPGRAKESIYRKVDFGDLATIFMLESRLTGRSDEIDWGSALMGVEPDEIPAAALATYEKVKDPSRTMLGKVQEDWLDQGLKASTASGKIWQVLANQVIMAKVVPPDFEGVLTEEQLAGLPGGYAQILPTAGVYALAGARLAPAMQAIYAGLSSIRLRRQALDAIHAELTAPGPEALEATPSPPLSRSLALRGVRFAYAGAERPALDGLDLEVAAGTRVGIVGGTGAGKTTARDLILGLLAPDAGEILVDGRPLRDARDRRGWRRTLGYVPQQIFLTDASIAENIAFGAPEDEIDRAAVERAARQAALHDFVTGELPRGYDTPVGDRGVRLSGGQRQRVGIARALYRDPSLLILDEATSALDTLTERQVMEGIEAAGRGRTVIMVAHRLTTVRGCDEIFLLQDGRVAARGDFETLLGLSPAFREMARDIV
ncbi:MAG: alkaline phosphatase D family protein, partial [Albimonas sp.]|uniref:alkaline phosphatase D family protein n=1 Tax=Albimonas sp. TaxID=1872425 RepID=UPI004055FC1F